MEDMKMVSVNAIERVMKNDFANEVIVQWHGIDVTVKKTIELKKAFEFVNQSVNSCFSSSDGSYMPEMKDFVIRACIVEKYTNITLPDDVEEMYHVLYATDLCDFLYSKIDHYQINSIIDAVNDKLEYMVDANTHAAQKALEETRKLAERFEEIFADITSDDIKSFANAIVNGGLSEEKLVEAYAKVKSAEQDATDDIVVPKIQMSQDMRDEIQKEILRIVNKDQTGADE